MIHLIVAEFHNGTHEGFLKTFKRINAVFFWKGMQTQILQYIHNCDVCLKNKKLHKSPAGLLKPLPIPHHVWTHIAMDFITHLPNRKGMDCILMVMDRLTSSSIHTAQSVAQVSFYHVFKLNGMPTN